MIFCQHFEFYCAANNIKSDRGPESDDEALYKKALFITMLGQITFIKLHDLASPADIVTPAILGPSDGIAYSALPAQDH